MGSDEQIAVDKLEEKIWKLCPHRAVIKQLDKSLKDLEKVRKNLREESSVEIIERLNLTKLNLGHGLGQAKY